MNKFHSPHTRTSPFFDTTLDAPPGCCEGEEGKDKNYRPGTVQNYAGAVILRMVFQPISQGGSVLGICLVLLQSISQFDTCPDLELPVDPGQVVLHGLGGEEELMGDLTVGIAFRHQLGDLKFLWG